QAGPDHDRADPGHHHRRHDRPDRPHRRGQQRRTRRTLAALTRSSGDLVNHLQNERAYAVMMLAAKNDFGREQALRLYEKEQPLVDTAKKPFSQQRAALSDLPSKLSLLLTRLDRNLGDLPALRSQVANGT